MKIEILPSAKKDLRAGFAFYEDQADGLGSQFRESLISEIDSLLLYGGIHRKVFGCHRLLAKRFPYAVYYSLEAETVLIRAVLDCRQNPEQTKRKLED